MISKPLRLGFLASDKGSSARAIMAAIEAGQLAADARLVVSNRPQAPILDFAREAAVPWRCIPTRTDPVAADAELACAMRASGAELIVLSGYLRRLGPAVLSGYAGRIVNIHPGPLPRFGGEGMYGRFVHEAVIAAGVSESAIVIHLVDEEYDRGPELARRQVPVLAGDSAEMLQARVAGLEPAFFVEVLRQVASGALPLPAG